MEKLQKRKCVFAGTFDPPTLGHQAMISDCLKLFDEVVVAVLVNPNKAPYFSVDERIHMLHLMFQKESRLTVKSFQGTAAELMEREETCFYVRGVRNTVDFEYENANFFATKKLNPKAAAIYLPCPQELLHVSSSMVRNSLKFGTPIDEYVTAEVKEYIQSLLQS